MIKKPFISSDLLHRFFANIHCILIYIYEYLSIMSLSCFDLQPSFIGKSISDLLSKQLIAISVFHLFFDVP